MKLPYLSVVVEALWDAPPLAEKPNSICGGVVPITYIPSVLLSNLVGNPLPDIVTGIQGCCSSGLTVTIWAGKVIPICADTVLSLSHISVDVAMIVAVLSAELDAVALVTGIMTWDFQVPSVLTLNTSCLSQYITSVSEQHGLILITTFPLGIKPLPVKVTV